MTSATSSSTANTSSSSRSSKPRIPMSLRLLMAVHMLPVFAWITIIALKLILEWLWLILHHDDNDDSDSNTGIIGGIKNALSAMARLTSLLIVAVGMLGWTTAHLEVLVDVFTSKTKPLFALRARLHRAVTMSYTNLSARILLVTMAVLALGCLGTVAKWSFQEWLGDEAGCAPCMMLTYAVPECPITCAWAPKVLLAMLLLLLQVALAVLLTARQANNTNNKEDEEEALEAVFAMLDSDFSGSITKTELQRVLGCTELQTQQFFQVFDTNHSGKLEIPEMRQLAKTLNLSDVSHAAPTTGAKTSKSKKGFGIIVAMISSPKQWTQLVHYGMQAFLCTTALLLPFYFILNETLSTHPGSALHVFSAYLIVAALNVVLYQFLWLVVLLADQILEMIMLLFLQPITNNTQTRGQNSTTPPPPSKWFYTITWLLPPLLLPLLSPPLAHTPPLLLLTSSLLFAQGLMLRERQAQIGSRSGSYAMYYVRIFIAGMFVFLGGLFVLGFVQAGLGGRKDLPSAFAARWEEDGDNTTTNTNATLGVHTLVGGVTVAKARLSTYASKHDIPKPDPRFGTCGASLHDVSLQEGVLWSQLAYLDCASTDFEIYTKTLFPEWKLVSPCPAKDGGDDQSRQSKRQRQRDHSQSVVFHHFQSQSQNQSQSQTNLIIVRGTHMYDFLDWIQDVELWLEAVLFASLSTLLPGLQLWSLDLINESIQVVSKQIDAKLSGKGHYYDPVLNYIQGVRRDEEEPWLVIGHSLAGGLVKIVGARLHIPAIAVSGPGIVESRDKFGVGLDEISLYANNIVPSHDVVPKLGTLGGAVFHVECPAQRPDVCHMPMVTVCALQRLCRGAAGSLVRGCEFGTQVEFDFRATGYGVEVVKEEKKEVEEKGDLRGEL